MRILIAVPAVDYIHSNFVQCLFDLTNKMKADGYNFTVKILTGTLVYIARDKLAKMAINDKYSHVLWLDADMIFSPDLLEDLRFSGKDFVSGIYHARRKPHMSCLFKEVNDDGTFSRFEEYPKETFEIGGCGFGCVLMRTDILQQVIIANHGTAFLPHKNFGEDLAFCLRCKRLGIKMYGEPGVICGHIGHEAIYPEDAQRYSESLTTN